VDIILMWIIIISSTINMMILTCRPRQILEDTALTDIHINYTCYICI